MLQTLIVFVFGAASLLIFFAAHEQSTNGWRWCLKCSTWFAGSGKRVSKLPWAAHFAIHADGECPACEKDKTQEVEREHVRRFSA
jgi:hypothetical protein